jgi:rifampicin phosphotransferase
MVALAYQSARHTYLAGMGIVVQRQVEAQVSGVLFTVSPACGSQILVEYCEGLGEALVSGAVNPGRIAIAREDLTWTELAALPPEGASQPQAPLLNGALITALARLALQIEAAFGRPQDIEWTIDTAGRLWVVQSRPITASATRRNQDGPDGPIFWSNANVNENFPQPISPLLYSVARSRRSDTPNAHPRLRK